MASLGTLILIIPLFVCLFNEEQGFCTYLLINGNSGLLPVITVITTAINLITAILITARILFFQRYMQRVGSGRNIQYTTIIIICVESSALIVVFSILYIVLLGQGNPVSFIFMASLVHVNVSTIINCYYSTARTGVILCLSKNYIGHIPASDRLSGGSWESWNVSTKTFWKSFWKWTCSIGVAFCIDKK